MMSLALDVDHCMKSNQTIKIILRHQMISNENLINIKVVEVIKIYNFYFGHLVI